MRRVVDGYCSLVRRYCSQDNIHAKASSNSSIPSPLPEPLKDQLSLLCWYSWPAIRDADRRRIFDTYSNGSMRSRVFERIFNHVTHGPKQGVSVTSDDDGTFSANHFKLTILLNGERREMRNNIFRDSC